MADGPTPETLSAMPDTPEPGGHPGIPGLPNLRDVGGHPTRDGRRVRAGLLYRSTDLRRLAGPDAIAFEALGIRTVYDLRTAAEREGQPDRLPPGSAYVVADILGDESGMSPAEFAGLFEDPETAGRVLGGGRSTTFFLDAYRAFVDLETARAGYHRVFMGLAAGDGLPASSTAPPARPAPDGPRRRSSGSSTCPTTSCSRTTS